MQVKIKGSTPQFGFVWDSDDHNGVTGGCRSALMNLAPGVSINLFLERGATYSDTSSRITSMSVFRL